MLNYATNYLEAALLIVLFPYGETQHIFLTFEHLNDFYICLYSKHNSLVLLDGAATLFVQFSFQVPLFDPFDINLVLSDVDN